MSEIKNIINDILKRVSGVIGVILVDIDGIPIEVVGSFDMNKEDLGALLAACYNSYAQVGLDLGQTLESIIVEFKELKLCQTSMPRGLLTVIANKDSYLGIIRLESKRAIEKLSKIMSDTQDIRYKLMEEHKFRWPSDKTIDEILFEFKKDLE